MLVFSPPMLGFRALQATMDLRATAGRQPRSAIKGIAARIPPTDRDRGGGSQALTQVILHQGARLERPEDRALHDALRIAASQPDADLAAFTAATAILLADRLQSGLGDDSLGFYWASFHEVYFNLPAHDRAAILQGFQCGAAIGRVEMPPPEPTLAHLTASEESVRSELLALAGRERGLLAGSVSELVGEQMATLILPHLRTLLVGLTLEPLTGDSPLFDPLLSMASNPQHPANVAAAALLLAEAVRNRDAEGWFSITLWNERIGDWLQLDGNAGRPILAGLRHLYESDPTWVPMPNRMASPREMQGMALLPVLDKSFSGGRHGARVG